MEYKEMRELINNVIENEFNHVQECDEREFTITNKEQIEIIQAAEELFNQLYEVLPKEYKGVLDDYSSAMQRDAANMCRFYFKEGVKAGTTNLQFLKGTEIMDYV